MQKQDPLAQWEQLLAAEQTEAAQKAAAQASSHTGPHRPKSHYAAAPASSVGQSRTVYRRAPAAPAQQAPAPRAAAVPPAAAPYGGSEVIVNRRRALPVRPKARPAAPPAAAPAPPPPSVAAQKAEQEPLPVTTVWQDLWHLALKIVIIALAFWALFTFVYGVFRCPDIGMKPAVQDGDIVLYYRLDKEFVAGEVAVVQYNGKPLTGRVVAVAGDTVDIDAQGLLVNGAYQQEPGIYAETTQFAGGVTFPITVGEGQVFLLGDNRTDTTDSRIYGCVNTHDTKGKVIGVIRRRNI